MNIRKKPASFIGRLIYWLVAIFLSLVIIQLVAGKQISEYLMRVGRLRADKGEAASARRYFKIADLIRKTNPLLRSEQRETYSVEKIRKQLHSTDKDEVISALNKIEEYRISELRPEVEWLAENGVIEVSEAADEALGELGMLVRCKSCGAEYYYKIPDSQMPYVCEECGKRQVYPADRFVMAKLVCSDPNCGHVFIVPDIPGEPLPNKCPKCGKSGAGRAYQCRSCGHIWIGRGFVSSCPNCHSNQVGGMSPTPQEVEEYYRTHGKR